MLNFLLFLNLYCPIQTPSFHTETLPFVLEFDTCICTFEFLIPFKQHSNDAAIKLAQTVHRIPSSKATIHRHSLDSLPPLDMLLLSIETYYQNAAQLELLQLQASKKGEWIKYLPSIGINYALTQKSDGSINTTPRPTLSYNSGKLYTAQKDKNTNHQKRQNILTQCQLLVTQDKQQVTQLYIEYEYEQETLKYDQQLLEIDEQLFQIKEAKYERGEILPLEYLAAKRSYLVQQRN